MTYMYIVNVVIEKYNRPSLFLSELKLPKTTTMFNRLVSGQSVGQENFLFT